MRRLLLVTAMTVLGACASTYSLPEGQRSRVFDLPSDTVWQAALAAVDDARLAVVETEREHGRIKARAGGSVWDLKGHVLIVIVDTDDGGAVRVDANVQNLSEDPVDLGESHRILERYLDALDRRLL